MMNKDRFRKLAKYGPIKAPPAPPFKMAELTAALNKTDQYELKGLIFALARDLDPALKEMGTSKGLEGNYEEILDNFDKGLFGFWVHPKTTRVGINVWLIDGGYGQTQVHREVTKSLKKTLLRMGGQK